MKTTLKPYSPNTTTAYVFIEQIPLINGIYSNKFEHFCMTIKKFGKMSENFS